MEEKDIEKEIEIEDGNEKQSSNEVNTDNSAQETDKESDSTDINDNCDEEEKDPMEKLQEELAELKDQYLRKVAEFENYRKRTLKEKTELILNGAEKTVDAILPVVDDMERAMANAEKTDDVDALKEGMDLIFKKLMKTLEGLGVKKIETDNKDFDTDFHEAVAMVPGMGDDKKGKVIDCVQTGYTLNDKVIRHAKVAVGQ
ncbi:MAG: nucleotide exchange factor GrpE [Prevotella sp.]|jgi:molecular chaperone GrpE|nr:nucleotide exchange factor GrpE [Prevotella sp.]